MKYIDADLLREKIAEQIESLPREVGRGAGTITSKGYGMMQAFQIMRSIIDSLQQEQPESVKGKFVFPKFLYARTLDNKTIDVSYVPQSMDAIEYVRNDSIDEQMDTGWISVKDRLPEVGHFVLTCVSDTGTPQCVGMALLLKDRTWWDGDIKVRVDYWMEVPKFNNEKK